jgi:hypothetical protein
VAFWESFRSVKLPPVIPAAPTNGPITARVGRAPHAPERPDGRVNGLSFHGWETFS